MNGSYNLCQRFDFDDGTSWVLRLPRISSVSSRYAAETVMIEIETPILIRGKASLPVPADRAWGFSFRSHRRFLAFASPPSSSEINQSISQ